MVVVVTVGPNAATYNAIDNRLVRIWKEPALSLWSLSSCRRVEADFLVPGFWNLIQVRSQGNLREHKEHKEVHLTILKQEPS